MGADRMKEDLHLKEIDSLVDKTRIVRIHPELSNVSQIFLFLTLTYHPLTIKS